MFILQIILMLAIFVFKVHSQCCLNIQGRNCIACPNGTHLFRGNCIIDVDNCMTYKDGFDCSVCWNGFQLNTNGECVVISLPSIVVVVPSADFTDVVIDPKSPTLNSDAYSLSVDYFKSFKNQLKNSDPIGVMVRTYKNNTVQVTIQFQDQTANKYYRAVIQPNLQSFIFKQVSFEVISAPTIIIPSKNGITNNVAVDTPTPTTTTTPTVQSIDLKNTVYKQKVTLLQTQAKKTQPFINTFIIGTISSNSVTGNSDINMNYTGNIVGDVYNIQGTVTADKKVIGVIVKQLVNKNITTKPILGSNTNTSAPSQNYLAYDPSANDQSYLISIDFVYTQFPKYNNITPTKVFKAGMPGSPFVTLYKITFTLLDLSSWQISTSFNSDTFLVTVLSQLQTALATKNLGIVYEKLDVNLVFRDFSFIIVSDYIIKQSNNKYKDATIRSVEKYEDQATMVTNYRVYYESGGFFWEILCQISKITFVPSGFQQTRKQPSKPVLGNPSSNPTINTNNPIIVNNNTTPKSNTTSTSTTSPNSTSTSNLNITNITVATNSNSSNTVNTTKNTTTSNNNSTNPTTSTTTSNTATNVSTSTATSTTTSTNTSTTTITNPNTTTTKNTTSNPTNATNNTVPSNNNSKPATPQKVIDNVIGHIEMTKQQASGAQFKQIDQLLRTVNPNQLNGSVFIGAYYTTTSFTRNYKIYYQKGAFDVYECRVSRDNLRKKTYIISFAKLG